MNRTERTLSYVLLILMVVLVVLGSLTALQITLNRLQPQSFGQAVFYFIPLSLGINVVLLLLFNLIVWGLSKVFSKPN